MTIDDLYDRAAQRLIELDLTDGSEADLQTLMSDETGQATDEEHWAWLITASDAEITEWAGV